MSYTRCTYCGSRLHTVANCPKTWVGSARRANLRCGYRGQSGHNSSACPHHASSMRRRNLESHYRGRAGQKFRPLPAKDRRLSQIFTPAKYKI